MSISQTDKQPALPVSVDDAAALLGQFIDREAHIVNRGAGIQYNDDDRAAVVAEMLVAIAGQIERLCEVMESALPKLLDLLVIAAYPGAHASTATSPGKTHSVDWFLSRERAHNPPFTIADAARYGGDDADYEDGKG